MAKESTKKWSEPLTPEQRAELATKTTIEFKQSLEELALIGAIKITLAARKLFVGKPFAGETDPEFIDRLLQAADTLNKLRELVGTQEGGWILLRDIMSD
jgi:hypothetical protein